jgi:UPF0716 family protein affecting phage T7 exclusion
VTLSSALLVSLIASQTPDSVEPIDAHPFALRAGITLAVSGALFVTGATFIAISGGQTKQSQTLEAQNKMELLSLATNNRVGGILLLVGGAITTAISVFLFQFQPTQKVSLALMPDANGATFSIGWVTP